MATRARRARRARQWARREIVARCLGCGRRWRIKASRVLGHEELRCSDPACRARRSEVKISIPYFLTPPSMVRERQFRGSALPPHEQQGGEDGWPTSP